MTWNTAALLIEAATVQGVVRGLPRHYTLTPETLDFRSAVAPALAPDVAIAQLDLPAGPVVEIWDPIGWLALDETVAARLSAGRRVYCMYASGLAARYGFRVFDDGTLVRAADWAGGGILSDAGDPLPAENEITARPWGHDEASLFCLAELLGLRPKGGTAHLPYRRVACTASALTRPSSIPESFRSSMSRKARRRTATVP